MNILICSDSFKDCMTSKEVSSIISQILIKKFPKQEINPIVLADGGEGSLIALSTLKGAKMITHKTLDALIRPIKASFLYFSKTKHAVIELAQTCGLNTLDHNERNCYNNCTFGLGDQILKAADHGASSIDILIGGSATNDLGLGMLDALGFDFYSIYGRIYQPKGKDMLAVKEIDLNSKLLENLEFRVVTDVDNKLLGSHGAAITYGKQKGATAEQIECLEAGAKNIVNLVKEIDPTDHHLMPGSGAAGGVGYGAMAILGATKLSGIDYMIDRLEMYKKIDKADLIITGEGRLDSQTKNGKLISGICKYAKASNIDVIAICALNELCDHEIRGIGLSAVYTLYDSAPEEISKSDTELKLKRVTQQIINDHLES